MLLTVLTAVLMILSLVSLSIVTFSRSTASGKWAAAAFSGALAYGASSYILQYCSTPETFILLTVTGLISLALTGIAFMYSIAAVCGVIIPKPLKTFDGLITMIYSIVIALTRLHGLCLTNVSVTASDESGMYTATYTSGITYYALNGVMIAAIAITGIYIVARISRKVVKASGSMKFLAVLAILLTLAVIAGGAIAVIAVTAAMLLLIIMTKSFDNSDLLAFGKSCGVDSPNDGVIILDKKDNYLFANKAAKSVFMELTESSQESLTKFISMISGTDKVERGDRIFSVKKNNYIDYVGNCDCTIIMVHDITEQTLRTNRLNEEAVIDSITGLNNRSGVVGLLEKSCEEESGILLNISIDGFKVINNVRGHEAANELLASFGKLLKNNTNDDDIRGRLGGEVFTVFLRNCDNEGVVAHLTMRLEEQINEAAKKQFGESSDISVGVSVGGVVIPRSGRSYDSLASLADMEREKISESSGHGYSIYGSDTSSSTISYDDDKPEDPDSPASDDDFIELKML
ncbi:MAG: GGDEF domain-containing protein [Ruminiclostridium sp.]|nr:GGDEF domain-containing protein [Ruminiclostridium sp.]